MLRLFKPICQSTSPSIGALDFRDLIEGQSAGQPVEADPTRSQTGVDFDTIPLRPFIANDPDMQALNPLLKMKPRTKESADYSIFRTVLEKAGFDLREMRIRDALERAQKGYAQYLDQSRVFVSYADQVPGYRRVVLLGPDLVKAPRNRIGFAGVTDDGRLVSGMITPGDRNEQSLQSVAEALEVIRVGREGWQVENAPLQFDLNRHCKSSRAMTDHGLEKVRGPLSSLRGPARHKITHILRGKADSRLNLARWAICDALDPETLRTMRGTGLTKLSHGSWLTGGDHAPGETVEARLQAVRSYPILARQMYESRTLREVIDDRAPLAPAIAEMHHVEERSVKRLRGLTWQRAASTPRDTTPAVREVLSMPEQALPKTRTEFRNLEILREFGRSLFGENLNQTLERLSDGGSPYRQIDRMKQTSGSDISDAVEFLATKLFVPAALNKIRAEADSRGMSWDHEKSSMRGLRKEARKSILAQFKVKELLDLSDRYHRNIARYEDRLDTISLEQKWTPMAGELALPGGYVARELTSANRLKAQGRAENHCVGGYASRVLDGAGTRRGNKDATLIFSLEKDGDIKSTVEIRCGRKDVVEKQPDGSEVTRQRLEARVHQSRGYHNETPSAAVMKMSQAIADEISKLSPEDFDLYLDRLSMAREEHKRTSQLNDFVKTCGFNPWDREKMQVVWNELQATLPRGLRKRGLDAFIDQAPIKGVSLSLTLGGEISNLWDEIGRDGEVIHDENQADVDLEDEDPENIPW